MGSDDKTESSYNIGKNCLIKNAIIDKNVIIGDNSQIINKNNIIEIETNLYSIKNGIIIIPQETIIPEGTII